MGGVRRTHQLCDGAVTPSRVGPNTHSGTMGAALRTSASPPTGALGCQRRRGDCGLPVGCRSRYDLHGRGGERRRPGRDARARHPSDAGALGGVRPRRRRVIVGEAAEQQGAADPSRVVREFKTPIGDSVPLMVGGSPFSAQALTAEVAGVGRRGRNRATGRAPEHVVHSRTRRTGGRSSAICSARRSSSPGWAGPGRARARSPRRRPSPTRPGTASRRGRPGRGLRPGRRHLRRRRPSARGTVLRLSGTPEGIEKLGGINFDEAIFQHVLTSLGGEVAGLDTGMPPRRWGWPGCVHDCVLAKEALSFVWTRRSRWHCPATGRSGSPAASSRTCCARRSARPWPPCAGCSTRPGLSAARPVGNGAGRWVVANPPG